MIPEAERTHLARTLTSAVLHAGEGEVAQGYILLWNGLQQAQRRRRHGAVWAPELVREWELALDAYTLCYRVELPDEPDQ